MKQHKCRVCGCTDDDCRQCIERTGEPCSWVEVDLCSACVKRPEIIWPGEEYTSDDGQTRRVTRVYGRGRNRTVVLDRPLLYASDRMVRLTVFKRRFRHR